MHRLFIANRNYSSWSLRAALVLARCGVPFTEVRIPLDEADTRARILEHSPSGRVPALELEADAGGPPLQVWDSLAIAETLAERYPAAALWPRDSVARAHARAISAEMHAGFSALRRELPMNLRARRRAQPGVEAMADVQRVCSIVAGCLQSYGGPWLFGAWSIADAMYAPVMTRFVTYAVDVDAQVAEYIAVVCADPVLAEWCAAALLETEVVAADEAGVPR